MKENNTYSFDDEYVSKFCYDIDNNRIDLHFTGYFDKVENSQLETDCVFIIENWEKAKSKVYDSTKFDELYENIGIIFMILHLEWKGDDLELIVSTIDRKYLTLLFIKPTVRFKVNG